MSLKIVETLENLIKTIPEVHSILILDSDGVPIVSAGEEIRNRSQYSASYNTLVEQSRKLGMGTQKYWIFRYEMSQVVLLSIDQFAVFVMASSNANTGILCALPTQLKSVLDECSQIVKEVANGQIAQINPKLMEESNLPVKRERQEEDNEHDEVREDAEPAVADTTTFVAVETLQNVPEKIYNLLVNFNLVSSVCSTFSSTSDFVCIGPAGVR
uniref:Roadblock/LAMTOR2 domain-containing protein n=1 Tax=Meloidogyne floridensis TaxID=298350 RepID=A0A915P0V9_9BILA